MVPLSAGGGRLTPPPELMFVGDGDFHAVGDHFLRLFIELGGLAPEHHVLDVGSGVGRMALPLTGYLSPRARYEGFDVVRAGVLWCQREITRRHPHFQFRHADVRNQAYNPKGRGAPAEYTFPYDTGAFDFVILTSIFTHMLPAGVDRYLAEIARVLKPDGRTLMTFFLLPPDARALIDAGRSAVPLRHERDGLRTANVKRPEEAIGYHEEWVRQRIAAHGLRVLEPVHYGTWCGRATGTSSHDLVVVGRSVP